MATLKEYQSQKKHIKNEVSPNLLIVRDSSTGDLVVANANANGDLLVATPSDSALDVKDDFYLNYESTPVTTSSWQEIAASLPADVSKISLADTSGEVLELGTGALGAEARKLLIPRGGIEIETLITSGTRVSIRAVSANATTGEIVVNFIGG